DNALVRLPIADTCVTSVDLRDGGESGRAFSLSPRMACGWADHPWPRSRQSTIPIVSWSLADPVADGLVASLRSAGREYHREHLSRPGAEFQASGGSQGSSSRGLPRCCSLAAQRLPGAHDG